MKKLNVYINNQKYIVAQNRANFIIGGFNDQYGTAADDEYANDYISNLSYMTLAQNNDNIVISFPACQDEELLERIRNNKTKVRVQLLLHIISAIYTKDPKNDTPRNNGKYFHYLELPYGHYWENYASRGSHHGESRDEYKPTNPEKFIRYRSHDPSYYGTTWLDLTAEQLSNGQAVLTNIYSINAGKLYQYNSAIRRELDISQQRVAQRFSVEMYCPAIHRPNKDPFYYEREENIKYIADNCIAIPYGDLD